MVEFIGFIISLVALAYLFIKQNHAPQRSSSSPEVNSGEDEGDDLFQEFMKAIEKENVEREVVKKTPPPAPLPYIKKAPPPLLSEHRLESRIEGRQLKSPLEDRQIKSKLRRYEEPSKTYQPLNVSHLHIEEQKVFRPSRIQIALKRLKNRQDLLIYQEVMSPPKALRKDSSIYP